MTVKNVTERDLFAMVLGRIILMLREARGLNQGELGVAQSMVSRIERGTTTADVWTVRRLGEALGEAHIYTLIDEVLGKARDVTHVVVPSRKGKGPWWEAAVEASGRAGLEGLITFATADVLHEREAARRAKPGANT